MYVRRSVHLLAACTACTTPDTQVLGSAGLQGNGTAAATLVLAGSAVLAPDRLPQSPDVYLAADPDCYSEVRRATARVLPGPVLALDWAAVPNASWPLYACYRNASYPYPIRLAAVAPALAPAPPSAPVLMLVALPALALALGVGVGLAVCWAVRRRRQSNGYNPQPLRDSPATSPARAALGPRRASLDPLTHADSRAGLLAGFRGRATEGSLGPSSSSVTPPVAIAGIAGPSLVPALRDEADMVEFETEPDGVDLCILEPFGSRPASAEAPAALLPPGVRRTSQGALALRSVSPPELLSDVDSEGSRGANLSPLKAPGAAGAGSGAASLPESPRLTEGPPSSPQQSNVCSDAATTLGRLPSCVQSRPGIERGCVMEAAPRKPPQPSPTTSGPWDRQASPPAQCDAASSRTSSSAVRTRDCPSSGSSQSLLGAPHGAARAPGLATPPANPLGTPRGSTQTPRARGFAQGVVIDAQAAPPCSPRATTTPRDAMERTPRDALRASRSSAPCSSPSPRRSPPHPHFCAAEEEDALMSPIRSPAPAVTPPEATSSSASSSPGRGRFVEQGLVINALDREVAAAPAAPKPLSLFAATQALTAQLHLAAAAHRPTGPEAPSSMRSAKVACARDGPGLC